LLFPEYYQYRYNTQGGKAKIDDEGEGETKERAVRLYLGSV
jgi:hypothetical protein